MIVRFDTWEHASIFAGRMRAEGRHSEILDGGMCFLWGPLAIGGVRVAVSDIVLDEDGEWPEIETKENEVANALRLFAMVFAVAGPPVLMAIRTLEHARHPERRAIDPTEFLVTLIQIAGVAVILALSGPAMPAFCRFLRNDESQASRFFRGVVAIPLLLVAA